MSFHKLNIDESSLADIYSLSPTDKSIALIYAMKQLFIKVSERQKIQFWPQRLLAYILIWQYPKYAKNYQDTSQKIDFYTKIIQELLESINHLWLDPRSSGTIDHQKVKHNEELLQQIYHHEPTLLKENVLYWRLITLALLSDRLQPAHLIVPFIHQFLNVDQLQEFHTNIRHLLEEMKNSPLPKHEVFNSFAYRMRNLCVTIEENAPQQAKFTFLGHALY